MVVARRFAAVAARAGEKACSVRSQRVVQSPHPFGRRCPRHPPKSLFGHLSVDVVGADAGGAGHAVGCRAAGRCATPVRPTCRRFPTLPGPWTRAALHRPGRARYAGTAQVVSTWGPADCRWGPSSHRNPTLHGAARLFFQVSGVRPGAETKDTRPGGRRRRRRKGPPRRRPAAERLPGAFDATSCEIAAQPLHTRRLCSGRGCWRAACVDELPGRHAQLAGISA